MDNNYANQNNQKNENDSKLFIIVISLLIFIIAVIGISVATFTYTYNEERKNVNTISTGSVYLNYTENTNGINITDAFPINDEVGKVLTDENQYFDFTVSADFSRGLSANYEIAAEKVNSSTLSNDEVRLYFERKVGDSYEEVMAPSNFVPLKEKTDLGTEAGKMLLDKGTFTETSTVNYRLRMWVAEGTVLGELPKNFGVRVSVKAKVDIAK